MRSSSQFFCLSSPPAALSVGDTAFFLDFDGTLVELASTPDAVKAPGTLIKSLHALAEQSAGAVAIISGRGIDAIDRLLAPLKLPVAGLHGAERRNAEGKRQHIGFDHAQLAQMTRALEQIVKDYPGMLLEHKGAALALHYRNAPACEAIAQDVTQRLVNQYADDYVVQPGKMVFEIKPSHIDKGKAIEAFLAEPPFAGRRPLFAGDDLTDEKGFAVVNRRAGVSIKVGAGETSARVRMASVTELRAWLDRLVNSKKEEMGDNINLSE